MSAAARSRTQVTIRVILVGLIVGMILAVIALGVRYMRSGAEPNAAPDYDGSGSGNVTLHVEQGDTLSTIGERLYNLGTVASTRAFTEAAVGTSVESIQPGYYQVRNEMSGDSVVEMLADPNTRVGFLDLTAGARLLDTEVVGGTREKGIFTLISEASCLQDRDNPGAEPACHSPQQIVDAAVLSDPTSLNVPEWAMNEVLAAPDPVRRLEGLIAPGVHNFDPNAAPADILAQLVSESAVMYDETGLQSSAQATGLTPYQTLTAASLVEKEAAQDDFGKVARVILNRLAEPMRLQFDSTVNYTLVDQEIATTDDARAEVNPWNTYAIDGLPYGPIGSPGLDALRAMENPEEGPWKYFVTVDQQGTTRFATEYPEHEQNQTEAIENGVLSSGR